MTRRDVILGAIDAGLLCLGVFAILRLRTHLVATSTAPAALPAIKTDAEVAGHSFVAQQFANSPNQFAWGA